MVEAAMTRAGAARGAWVPRAWRTIIVALGYGLWRMKTLPIHDVGVIGMVQPNEAFSEKWNPGHADSAMNTLLGLSRAVDGTGDQAAAPGVA